MLDTSMLDTSPLNGRIGLFFIVAGSLFLRSLRMEQAEHYGQFRIYPHGHDDIWEQSHRSAYGRDFDYFPRGRFLFDTERGIYLLYHDRCIEKEAIALARRFSDCPVERALDEHYQCHACNAEYVL